MSPKVTVLMSVYNGERYLREAIQSILNQTFTDFEFLIIDDASTDSSLEIIQSYNDPRIRIVKNRNNLGLTKSLNIGIKDANGEFIARMDADDVSHPQRLYIQTEYMDQNPGIAVCGSAISIIGKRDTIIFFPHDSEEIKVELLFHPPFAHPSVIFRKKIFEDNKLFYNEKFRYAQDYELWTRCAGLISFSNINQVLLYLRTHDTQIGKMYSAYQKKCRDLIIKRNVQKIIETPTETELAIHTQLINILEGGVNRSCNSSSLPSDIGKWLRTIQKKNKKVNVFNQNTLNKVLALKWFTCWLLNKYFLTNLTISGILFHLYWMPYLFDFNTLTKLIHYIQIKNNYKAIN